jgi:hypothetical protein
MRQIFLLAIIIVVGAAVMAPVFILLDLEPRSWDFVMDIAGRPTRIPATWSLCASTGMALFYWFMKK